MAKKSKESSYYHWTQTLPTHGGLWYRMDRISKISNNILFVKGIKHDTGIILCYLGDTGWFPVDEDTKGYFEWSSKPVPFPETK